LVTAPNTTIRPSKSYTAQLWKGDFAMLVLYTNLNRKRHTVEAFDKLHEFEIDTLGDAPWPKNTSFWFVPGTLNPEE